MSEIQKHVGKIVAGVVSVGAAAVAGTLGNLLSDPLTKHSGPVAATPPAIMAPVSTTVTATPPPLQPSYDCAHAQRAIERLICSNDGLADADEMMSDRWQNVRGAGLANQQIITEQNLWIQQRNACVLQDEPAACVRQSYRDRIAVLDALLAPPSTDTAVTETTEPVSPPTPDHS